MPETHGIMTGSTETEDVGLKGNHTKRPTHKRMPLLGSKGHKYVDKLLIPFLSPRTSKGEIIIYTDGACSEQGRDDLARAGYGIYYGHMHPWNEHFVLHGCYQSSDRAELAAIVRTIVSHESPMKIWIWSDNESAVNTSIDILVWLEGKEGNGFKKQTPNNRDIWKIFVEEAKRIGPTNIKVSWVKGHATDNMINNGEVSVGDKRGPMERTSLPGKPATSTPCPGAFSMGSGLGRQSP